MNFFKKNLTSVFITLLIVIFLVIFFWDRALFFGLILTVLLATITLFIFYKLGIRGKTLYLLFLTAFFIHLGVILLFHYTHFQPFGPGDYVGYQQIAEQVAQRIHTGNYSLKGLNVPHYYPVLIGIIYAFTLPEIIIGELLGAWLAALSVAFVFLIVKEIGGSKRWAFLLGLITAVYPSYIFYGSLLLKDTFVAPLALFGLLLSVKMMKSFSWQKFAGFFIVLTALIHLRFYVGFALLFSFIICWFLISNSKLGERIVYGLIMIFLLGFSPYLLNYGYYGSTPILGYLNPPTITIYREVVYAPLPDKPIVNSVASSSAEMSSLQAQIKDLQGQVALAQQQSTTTTVPSTTTPSTTTPSTTTPSTTTPPTTISSLQTQIKTLQDQAVLIQQQNNTTVSTAAPIEKVIGRGVGVGSSFVIKAGFDNPFKFVFNYFLSFICSLLGPFPWQIKHIRQAPVLFETIPWYFLMCVLIYGIIKFIKRKGFLKTIKHYRFSAPLFLFSIVSLGALSLYMNNFGIITRIRIPSLIALLCLVGLYGDPFNKLTDIINYYEKKFVKLYNLPFLQGKFDAEDF